MRGWGVFGAFAGLLIAGCQTETNVTATESTSLCGSPPIVTHFDIISTKHDVRDEGAGVVSDLTESAGVMPYRALELVDCRGGVVLSVSDAAIPDDEILNELPVGTAFQSFVDKLRAAGQLSDLEDSSTAFERSGSAVGKWRKWDSRRTQVRLADPSLPTVGYGCACQRFYPGTSSTWVPSLLKYDRKLAPKTLPEARAMVAAWQAEQRAALSARTDN